ncbi:MAG TPA: radical SAM protein [Rectinemataceae bacterium]|nr:radical SAM protein [Rectinemataceae bacterium]
MIPPLARSLFSASRAISGETLRAIANPNWNDAEAKILIVRLSPIRDVDRSSSHSILFSEVRAALPGAYVDFAFFPDRGDRDLIAKFEDADRENPTIFGDTPVPATWPWFFGAQSGESPASFDLILVSNAFGLELVNLPRLFATSGIPSRATARLAAAEPMPIVILGGSNAGQAAAIVEASGDGLVDGVFLGEGEGAIGPLAKTLTDRDRGRGERLFAASSIEGFWPATHPELRVHRRILHDSPPPLLSWPPFDTPEAKTARLQITAGCPGYCSFCFEGWDRRPYRELPFEAVVEAAREIKARNGIETLEVYSFNFNTHADIFKLLFELGRIFKNVNLMSQRLDILAQTPSLVTAELASGKRSFTLGVEGISARMRAYYRKGLDEEGLARLIELLVRPEVREIKLFYIIAGFEDEGDLDEFAAFTKRLAERRKEIAPNLRLLASAGYLVRLPGTPLGHAPLIFDEGPYATIAEGLARACADSGVEWRLAVHFDEFCADQLLSLGGGRLLPWLENLGNERPGLVYDGSLGKGVWPNLEAFARSRGILDEALIAEKGPDATPLFPFLESRDEAPVLHREYLKAKAFIDRTSCLGGRCSDCGACPDPESRLFLTRHRILPQEGEGNGRLEKLALAKRGFARILVEMDRPASLAGASIEAQEAWLFSRICSFPEGPKALFSVRLAFPLPDKAFGLAPGSTGWARFELEGPSAVALAAMARTAGFETVEAEDGPTELEVRIRLPTGFDRLAKILQKSEAAPVAENSANLARKIVAKWLSKSRMAFTERREGLAWLFDIASRDLAKKAVFAARVENNDISLSVGPKVRLSGLGEGLGTRLPSLLAAEIRLTLR